jgi:hypothetical protein
MTPHTRRIIKIGGLAAVLYLGTYLWYRAANTEVWARDGRSYVIFGSRLTYYFYRPAAYIDGTITEMGFHIGPHQ